jgi:hypothetical protein
LPGGQTIARCTSLLSDSAPGPTCSGAAIAGDAITNYRGALDHLLRALAVEQAGKDPPPRERQIQFPICDTEDAFNASLKRHRLGQLATEPALVTAVRELQPFSTGAILGRLRDLDDQHKHRRVHVGAYNVQSFDMRMLLVAPAEVRVIEGPFEQETVIVAVRFDEPTDIGQFRLDAKIRLSFTDEPLPRPGMLQVISDCRQAVLGARDALLAALGAPVPPTEA